MNYRGAYYGPGIGQSRFLGFPFLGGLIGGLVGGGIGAGLGTAFFNRPFGFGYGGFGGFGGYPYPMMPCCYPPFRPYF